MKKQILALAAIGIISLSANAYAQSNNETPPNEPYVGSNEDNQQSKPEDMPITSRVHDRDRKQPNEETAPPQNRTGHDD